MGISMMTICWRPPLELMRKLLLQILLSLALAPGKHFLLQVSLASPLHFLGQAHAHAQAEQSRINYWLL